MILPSFNCTILVLQLCIGFNMIYVYMFYAVLFIAICAAVASPSSITIGLLAFIVFIVRPYVQYIKERIKQ